MESIRKDELQELLDVVRMKPYGKILITGAAGSGKTFLLSFNTTIQTIVTCLHQIMSVCKR